MKTLRSSNGPFRERPFYTDEEIERICEDVLRETGYMPSSPQRVRIDRVIEKKFGVPIIYEEMDANVLGFTEFGPNGVVAVHIAQAPHEKRTTALERRENTTLAHEAGHGLMHAHLFALESYNEALFGGDADVKGPKILCRDPVATPVPRGRGRYDGRWWELQANRAIGALLMPRELFLAFMECFTEQRGSFGRLVIPDSRRSEAARAAAEAFEVNPAAASVRIDGLFPEENDQLTF